MADRPDYFRWLARRRELVDAPDEETIRRRMDEWRRLLRRKDPVPEELLDKELVRLLERIHRPD